jgi:hypothetical protein
MRNTTNLWARNAALVLACWSYGGCGDDKGPRDAGTAGAAAGRGGVGAHGGAAAGRSGAGGAVDGGAAGSDCGCDQMCSEPPPEQPVVCAGRTCAAPAELVLNNACVVPCCVDVADVATCGAKSTSVVYPAECTLLARSDPACPTVSASVDGSGTITMFEGCCNVTQGKCGIVSPVRPGCITQSVLFTLPDPLKSCDGGSVEGSADAGRD